MKRLGQVGIHLKIHAALFDDLNNLVAGRAPQQEQRDVVFG